MAKLNIPLGNTGPKTRVFIWDSDSSPHAGKTGLTFETSGLMISVINGEEDTVTVFSADDDDVEDITTVGDWAAPASGKCRFKEVDAANFAGLYELQFEAALFDAAGAETLQGKVFGAADADECPFEIQFASVPSDIRMIQGETFDADVPPDANVKSINDSEDAAIQLALSAGLIIIGAVDDTVSPTTTVFETADITDAAADHYKGRTVLFTTGALRGQARPVSAYALVSGRGRFTVSPALTSAPADGVGFILV